MKLMLTNSFPSAVLISRCILTEHPIWEVTVTTNFYGEETGPEVPLKWPCWFLFCTALVSKDNKTFQDYLPCISESSQFFSHIACCYSLPSFPLSLLR